MSRHAGSDLVLELKPSGLSTLAGNRLRIFDQKVRAPMYITRQIGPVGVDLRINEVEVTPGQNDTIVVKLSFQDSTIYAGDRNEVGQIGTIFCTIPVAVVQTATERGYDYVLQPRTINATVAVSGVANSLVTLPEGNQRPLRELLAEVFQEAIRETTFPGLLSIEKAADEQGSLHPLRATRCSLSVRAGQWLTLLIGLGDAGGGGGVKTQALQASANSLAQAGLSVATVQKYMICPLIARVIDRPQSDNLWPCGPRQMYPYGPAELSNPRVSMGVDHIAVRIDAKATVSKKGGTVRANLELLLKIYLFTPSGRLGAELDIELERIVDWTRSGTAWLMTANAIEDRIRDEFAKIREKFLEDMQSLQVATPLAGQIGGLWEVLFEPDLLTLGFFISERGKVNQATNVETFNLEYARRLVKQERIGDQNAEAPTIPGITPAHADQQSVDLSVLHTWNEYKLTAPADKTPGAVFWSILDGGNGYVVLPPNPPFLLNTVRVRTRATYPGERTLLQAEVTLRYKIEDSGRRLLLYNNPEDGNYPLNVVAASFGQGDKFYRSIPLNFDVWGADAGVWKLLMGLYPILEAVFRFQHYRQIMELRAVWERMRAERDPETFLRGLVGDPLGQVIQLAILEDKDLLNAIGGEVGLPWLALTAWPLFTHGAMRAQSARLSGVSEALMHNGSFWTQTQDQMKTPLPSVEIGALKDPGFRNQ